MELLTPGTGLILWQLIIFVLLFFLLAKLAWKPIIQSLKEREDSIQNALDSAEKARHEMAQLQSENQNLLKVAREERDVLAAQRLGRGQFLDLGRERGERFGIYGAGIALAVLAHSRLHQNHMRIESSNHRPRPTAPAASRIARLAVYNRRDSTGCARAPSASSDLQCSSAVPGRYVRILAIA